MTVSHTMLAGTAPFQANSSALQNDVFLGGKSVSRIIRVASLLRVSTTRVEQEESPEHQLEYIREEIKRHQGPEIWVDTGLVYEDELTGALVLERPGIRKLLADVEAGKIDMVAMKSIARLGRDTLGLLALKRRLWDDLGVDLVALQDGYRASRDQELIFLIHADRAQHGRLEISRNVRNAVRQIAKKGLWPGGRIPFGYVRSGRHSLVPHPETAKIVQEIFRLRGEERWSYRAIQEYLNHVLQVPAPSWWFRWHLRKERLEERARSDDRWAARLEQLRKKYEGRRPLWRQCTVIQILRNTAYYGELRFYRRFWRRSSGGKLKLESRPEDEHIVVPCPPLVSRELWERANEPLRPVPRSERRQEYLLSGLAFCGLCGATLQGTLSTAKGTWLKADKVYYICSSRREGFRCSLPVIPGKLLEAAVLKELRLELRNLTELPPPQYEPSAQDENKKQLRQLEEELADLRDQRRYYRNQHRLGKIPDWELDEEIRRIETREKQVLESIQKLRLECDDTFRTSLRKRILEVARRFDRLDTDDPTQLRKLLTEAVDRIVVTYKGGAGTFEPLNEWPPEEILRKMFEDPDARVDWVAALTGCNRSRVLRAYRSMGFPPKPRTWEKLVREAFFKKWSPVIESLRRGAAPDEALSQLNTEPLLEIRVHLRVSLD